MPEEDNSGKRLIPFETNSPDNVTPPIKQFISWGLMILGIFFSIFIIWSLVSPIEKAAVAKGKVTVHGYHKAIQHLEGGIIKVLYIREGTKVKKGDLLVKLDDTKAKATLDLLTGQLYALLGDEARLLAEKVDAKEIKFPEMLLKNL